MLPQSGPSVVSQNDPALGYTPTAIMGNTNFQISVPPTKGEVQAGYPELSYISIEAEFFFNSMSNPMSSPYTTYGGTNTGQQVIGGQYTMADPTGTTRFQQGFQSVSG
jgi:hypothetical protein